MSRTLIEIIWIPNRISMTLRDKINIYVKYDKNRSRDNNIAVFVIFWKSNICVECSSSSYIGHSVLLFVVRFSSKCAIQYIQSTLLNYNSTKNCFSKMSKFNSTGLYDTPILHSFNDSFK